MAYKTTDLNYSYNRKTYIHNDQLVFTYSYDLNKEIIEAGIADMILYTCQSDVNLQRILNAHESEEEMSFDMLLAIANEYRLFLLNNK
ncbi:hypothetical protein BN85401940 [Alteracholeplasma palmae J233]|uniref:Uncharacterized protein n=1 Tax=Alteracholeplasma palmae (strain ATCC 49389 / J233) TaxID=1318466 RepID=U4KR11_ALTPJ|nr:hypothetical protein [Alteracholeplasma palmae]CCV63771.1 hypothetical protein BN85401940 [Alteracholeplasma palmae J233]